jgi:hypothetical protein
MHDHAWATRYDSRGAGLFRGGSINAEDVTCPHCGMPLVGG